jgi:endonuclease YncB( thermonuclease family)
MQSFTAATAGAFMKIERERRSARDSQRRPQADENSGDDGDHRRENKNDVIDACFLKTRNRAWGKRDNYVETPDREQHCQCCAKENQYAALDQKLSHYLSATCTQRRANGQLASPCERIR